MSMIDVTRIAILYLEDDPDMHGVAVAHLSDSGLSFDLIRVETQADFLSELATGRYDLVLIDYELPDTDGLSALALLRDRHPHLPAVVVSGVLSEEVAVMSLKRGATDYVHKQNIGRLGMVVKRIVEERRHRLAHDQAVAALDESRAFHEDIAAHIPGGIFQLVSRPGGGYALPYVNRSFVTLTGLQASDLAQDAGPFLSRIHPDDYPAVIISLGESAQALSVWRREFRILRPGEATVWARAQSAPQRLPDGTVRWNGVLLDITDLHNTQERLGREQERLQQWVAERTATVQRQAQIIDQIHDAVVMIDLNGMVTDWNSGAERLFGYAAEEVIGRHIGFAYPDGSEWFLEKQVIAPLKSAGQHETEVRMRRKSGEVFHAHLSLSLLHDDAGEPVGMVGYALDITPRVQAENALRASEARLRSVVDTAVDGIITIDEQGVITDFNPAAEKIFGYHTAEVLGRNVKLLMPEPYRREHDGYMQRYLATGEARIIGIGREVAGRRKDGSEFPMELAVSQANIGERRLFIGLVRDVTKRKQAERDLREAHDRLAHLLGSFPTVLYSLRIEGEELIPEWISDNVARVAGYSVEESLAPGWCYSHIHPDDRPATLANMKELLATGKLVHEYRFQHKQGHYFWILDQLRVSYDRDHRPIAVTGTWTDVTDRKSAEDALRHSEERLRRSQIYANIGTWDWDIQTGELYWSERIGPLFGYPEGKLETTYENFLKAVHPDDRQRVIDAVNAAVEHDEKYELEHRNIWPDGTVRWMLERGAVVRDDNGKPLHMLGVVQDITDRKDAQLALEENTRLLKEAQRLGRIGHWSWDVASGTIEWSDEIYRIFGREPESFEPTYEHFLAVVHPDDLDRIKASERAAFSHGEKHSIDHRVVLPDGSVRWVHEEALAHTDELGTPVYLAGTVQDITERKEIEQELERQKALFEAIFRDAPDALVIADTERRIVLTNPAFTDLFGYTLDEIRGEQTRILYASDEDFMRQGQRRYNPDAVNLNTTDEIEYRRKDGSTFPSETVGSVLRDRNGVALGFLGILRDISMRKQAEKEVLKAKEEAEQASRAKSEFLSRMSHELRTPMNAILGFTQLMEMDETLGQDQQENLSEIHRAGEHLLELINEVLDLARIEAGRIDLTLEPVPATAVLDECLTLIAPLAAKREIEVIYDRDQFADVTLHADRTRLKQVFLNLLSNAIKYNRPAGRIVIECRAHPQKPDYARISVSDTGPGITPSQQGQLFTAFTRLGAERSGVEGTGIGLVIAKSLAELMGGKIGVESSPGVGSTFWTDLPLAVHTRGTTYPPVQATAPEHTTLPAADKQHVVLYIEDNPANLRLVNHVLKRRPQIALLTAHEPHLGLELAKAHHPDMVLLDINLPGLNGYAVLERLRGDPALRDVPVVAISANAMPNDVEKGKAAGFDGYLTKPLDVSVFLETVDRILDHAT